jgi:hypothetical protein
MLGLYVNLIYCSTDIPGLSSRAFGMALTVSLPKTGRATACQREAMLLS